NSKRLHLPIEVTALQSQYFCGTAYVAVIVIELFQDVVAFVGRSRLMQCHKLAAGTPAAITIDQWRKMLSIKACRGGIHNHDALNHIAEFANVPRPGITHECVDRLIGDFSPAAPVMG